ncbi:hypothetical protein LguiB_023383 [Lonicera macranthoides]
MLADIFPQNSLRDHHHQDSRIETEPVVRSLICVPHTDCVSNENVSLIEDDDVLIPPWTFLIPDQDGDPMTINIPSDVNMNHMQIPEHVSVEKVSTLLRMIVGLQNILVSKMLESRDRLNASNVVIHELRRRIPGRLAAAKGLDVPPCYGSLPSEPDAALG